MKTAITIAAIILLAALPLSAKTIRLETTGGDVVQNDVADAMGATVGAAVHLAYPISNSEKSDECRDFCRQPI
jgi:hypothetical protein